MLFSPAFRFACVALLLYVLVPLSLGNAYAGIHGLLTVAVGLLTAAFLYGELPRRYNPSNLPGPPGKWLIGNLDLFVKLGGYHKCYEQVTKDYGRVARVQMGHWPQIIVQEPALIKEIGLEKFQYFQDRKMAFLLRKNKGLLWSKGEEWHKSRRALNPAFNSIKLSNFCPTIARHCNALTQRLNRVLDGKNSNEPMDVFRLFGDLTMDVIGSTSFDAEFGLQNMPMPGEEGEAEVSKGASAQPNDQQQKDILEAAKTIFMNSGGPMGTGGNLQKLVTVVVPFLLPIYKLFYPLLMTPEAKGLWKSIRTLDKVMGEILQGRSQFNTKISNNNDTTGDDSITTTNTSADTKKKKAFVDANFIDLVRKATDPDSGVALDSIEVRDQLNLFVLAGYETTANTLAFTTFLLAQHPEVERKLVEEIQRLAPNQEQSLDFKDLVEFRYTHNVVNEALRLYPPGAMLTREAKETVTIGGKNKGDKEYVIPKGAWVIIPVWSLHRDELFWGDKALEFDPDRFQDASKLTKYAHLPFGIGPRNCIGQRFAMEEVKLALIAIYRNYTFRLHDKTSLPLQLKAGITLSPTKGVWMTVQRREQAADGALVASQ